MANDRWRSDQDRDRYRDEGYGRGRDRGEWDREQRQGVSGERDFASRDFREPERGFYSGSAEERRGYQGYGGGGGDPRSGRFSGRFSDERRGYERGEWRERGPGSTDVAFGEGFGSGYRGQDWSERAAYSRSPGSRSYGGPEQDERGFWDRASDEVSSWFGDDEAERRRERDYQQSGQHRGRGPKGYTRSDDRIREDVCDRLTEDPFVDASDIEINVSGSEVTLSGTVDNREVKRRAEVIAEHVSGVNHVQNNLRVQQSSWGGSAAAGGVSGSASTGGRVTGGTPQRGESASSGTRKIGTRA
jgi:osmotically-inducible protein OsmY